ncbi:MAG: hypothetical protein AB8B47_03450 [Roseobacter sp.]
MHFGKIVAARALLNDDMLRDDTFTALIERIEALPADQRGIQALSLSASLLEMAAYELAGTVATEQVGALIENAAHLSRQSAACAAGEGANTLKTGSRVH